MTTVNDNLPVVERKIMQEIAMTVNNELCSGNASAEKACRHYIAAGLLMNKAKLELGSDLKFGQWRKENLNCSSSSSKRYMQVASKYGDLGVDLPKASMSLLSEMAQAPKEVEEAAMKKLKADEKLSVRDVRNMKKESTDVGPPNGKPHHNSQPPAVIPSNPPAIDPPVKKEPRRKAAGNGPAGTYCESGQRVERAGIDAVL